MSHSWLASKVGREKRGCRYWEGGIVVPHLVASKVGREKRGCRYWEGGIVVPHLVS